jgi:magnesium-transporting ATPase (P-type)
MSSEDVRDIIRNVEDKRRDNEILSESDALLDEKNRESDFLPILNWYIYGGISCCKKVHLGNRYYDNWAGVHMNQVERYNEFMLNNINWLAKYVWPYSAWICIVLLVIGIPQLGNYSGDLSSKSNNFFSMLFTMFLIDLIFLVFLRYGIRAFYSFLSDKKLKIALLAMFFILFTYTFIAEVIIYAPSL